MDFCRSLERIGNLTNTVKNKAKMKQEIVQRVTDSSTKHTYKHSKPFKLENGEFLALEIAYHTYGKLNAQANNMIWVCHALTANSDVFDWWKGLFGDDDLFNPHDHFIVCANVLASPYGTSNPLSIDPKTGEPYYLSFPMVTIRDMVAAHRVLAYHLGIGQIDLLIGGSLGGQQAMEWAIAEPERIKKMALIATNAQHSPWGIAFNQSQRLAIEADHSFYTNKPSGGNKGLKAARSMALLSYRTYAAYGRTQKERVQKLDDFKAAAYQSYQGDKLVGRFNAYSYWYLTKAMDSHHVGRGRGSVAKALRRIKAETLVLGISGDLLFPIKEQKRLAKYIPNADFVALKSTYGHDGFLVETDALKRELAAFIEVKLAVV